MSNDVEELTGLDLLLDTSIQIDVLRGRNGNQARLDDLLIRGYTLHASVVNLAEVCSGLRTSEEIIAQDFLESLNHLAVTRDIARNAGFLQRSLRQRGLTVQLPDLLIAATALEYDFLLITDNLRDFRNTGARVTALSGLK